MTAISEPPVRSLREKLLWILWAVLGILGWSERIAGWISGATVGDFSNAADNVAKWISAVPVLGSPATQFVLATLSLIGFIISGWLVWRRPNPNLNPAQPHATAPPSAANLSQPESAPPAIPPQTASNDAPLPWGVYEPDRAKVQRSKNEIDEWLFKRMAPKARISLFNDAIANENPDDGLYREVITELMRDMKWHPEARAVDHWVSIGLSTLVERDSSFQQQKEATLNRLFTAAFREMEANSFSMQNCEKFAEVVRRLVIERRRHSF